MQQYEGSPDNRKLIFLELVIQLQKQIVSLEEQIAQLQKQKTIQLERTPSSLDSLPSTPMIINSRPTTPWEQDYMHNADWVNKFLFFIEEVGYRSCVVALTPNYLVTFRHGTHMFYVKDTTVVRVVSVASSIQYQATVVYISDEEDFIILKSNEKVMDRNCPTQKCDVMKPFVVCGFGKGFPEPTFIRGTVYSIEPFIYENNGKRFGPFIYGTAKTSPGDSGAACFGICGLMAINLGTTTMLLKEHNEAISEAAIFSANNYMVTADRLRVEIAKLEPNKPPKRPYHEIIIEGIDDLLYLPPSTNGSVETIRLFVKSNRIFHVVYPKWVNDKEIGMMAAEYRLIDDFNQGFRLVQTHVNVSKRAYEAWRVTDSPLGFYDSVTCKLLNDESKMLPNCDDLCRVNLMEDQELCLFDVPRNRFYRFTIINKNAIVSTRLFNVVHCMLHYEFVLSTQLNNVSNLF